MPTLPKSVLLCVPLFFVGCSSSSDGGTSPANETPATGDAPKGGATATAAKLKGLWKGSAAGVDVTFEFSEEATSAGTILAIRTLSTSNTKCLANGRATGELVKTSASFLGNGSGSTSNATSLTTTGEVTDSKLTGKLELVSPTAGCQVPKTDIVLTRSQFSTAESARGALR